MARRAINRLDPLTVKKLIGDPKKNKPAVAGRHPDGWGLYLVVEPNSSARWSFLYRSRVTGKRREMGLGSTVAVSLALAREKAADAREALAKGNDPITEKRASAAIPTFGQAADELMSRKEKELRSKGARDRAKNALEVICKPIRDTPVNLVDTEAVLSVLRPIWSTKSETARKARGLIEQVLAAAKAKGHRTGDNPAALKGHLDHWLDKRPKGSVEHHASMHRDDLPDFLALLRSKDATSARALEFQVLTAARPGEAIGARWSEIDLQAKLWTIPAARMKADREHRVPLSPRAVEILQEMTVMPDAEFVFPGSRPGRPMSGAAFERLLTRMKVVDVTPHGFRSTFRDWAGEVSSFPRELAEAALSHVVGDATERAYARGDALEKRRKMMITWANFCAGVKGNVTPIRKAVA